MKPSAVKDKRARAKREARDAGAGLEALVGKALSGEGVGRTDAEGLGLQLLGMLMQLYIVGEDGFSQKLREFVKALCNREDPLRKNIQPEQWAALWPPINTMLHAREDFLDARREEGRQKEESLRSSTQPGGGVVGAATASGSEEVQTGGGR